MSELRLLHTFFSVHADRLPDKFNKLGVSLQEIYANENIEELLELQKRYRSILHNQSKDIAMAMIQRHFALST
jgi:hypothetical protein